jgi:NAD(P)H dehydrogenase (quinone)
MSILVTGASGQLARLVAARLFEQVDPGEVILVTRTPEAIADLGERGAAVRHGDFDDPAALAEAFAGAERMLLVSASIIGARLHQHQAAVDAAVAAGVRSIAYTSGVNPSDSNPGAAFADHRATEEMVRASGLGWTFLRNAIYADSLVTAAPGTLASGTVLTNAGEGKTAYVARADCAAAAAAVLSSDGHDGKAYDITGPEALGARELAALYSDLGGKPVEPAFVDDDGWVAAMVELAGMPEGLARTIATFGIAARQGYAEVVSTSVRDLSGREPQTVREVLAAGLAAAAS